MSVFQWSQTAGTNATADPSINWAEGQAPSSVNDSARAMMAALAKYRDDIVGAIVTGGTSTAYTVASLSVFDSLADMNGQQIWFTPHTTNGATVTLNVDSLGAKPLRTAPSAELLAGVLIQGTPYGAIYNNSDGAWYLKGYFGQPYAIPLGGMIDYTGTTAPNSQFVLPYGQAISRTTYASYFSMVSTTFGNGDGSTTFNVPDLRGRTVAGVDNMGGSAASRLTTGYFGGANPDTIGAAGGSQNQFLVTANLPPYTPSGTITNQLSGGAGSLNFIQAPTGGPVGIGGTASGGTTVAASVTSTFTGAAQGGLSVAFATIPPTMTLNKILRII